MNEHRVYNTYYYIAVFVLCCLLAMGPNAHAGEISTAKALASHSWKVSASPNLDQNPPATPLITSFLRSVEIAAYGESLLGDGASVCSYLFADLRGNGNFSLVVSDGITSSVRACASAWIIDKTPKGFQIYSTSGSADMASNIEDLRKDGKFQVLFHSTIAEMTAGCSAEWVSYFEWNGKEYANVSSQFQDLYRKQLADLEKEIAAHKASEPIYEQPVCKEAEAAALKRYLGISPEAGLDLAIRMSNQKAWNDWPFRMFAAQLFESIGSPTAKANLEKLTHDAYPPVVIGAKGALARLSGERASEYGPATLSQVKLESPIKF